MIDYKKPVFRKPKNKFIHKSSNEWDHCYVTKTDDSTIYVTKTNPNRNWHTQVKSYLNNTAHTSTNIPIYYNQKIIEFIPRQLNGLFHSIENSKYLLNLKDDWDGDGAKCYSVETWRKAVLYISKFSTKVLKTTGQIIASPKIYHGPNGSIDMYWENNSFNLLLNFPESGPGTFYGDDYNENKSEGFFDPTNINSNVLPFLLELK